MRYSFGASSCGRPVSSAVDKSAHFLNRALPHPLFERRLVVVNTGNVALNQLL